MVRRVIRHRSFGWRFYSNRFDFHHLENPHWFTFRCFISISGCPCGHCLAGLWQLLGALLSLIVVWLLERFNKIIPIEGISFSLGIFGISTILFGLSYLRADPSYIWNGLRIDAWGAIALMIFWGIIVVVLLAHWRIKKHSDSHI